MKYSLVKRGILLAIAASATIAGGCLSSGGSSAESASPPPTPGNSAPSISGSPSSAVTVGNNYSFTPSASDPDGDNLTFTIVNKPSWANFSESTGTLSGLASSGTEGTYTDIQISVSDGSLTDSLSSFSIDVTQVALGSATLSWTAPTDNTDGSAITDLAAYKVYYGVNQGTYPNQIRIDNPGITTYVVENLTPDTYYFVTTAINSEGRESSFSNVASKTVMAN